MWRVEKGTEIKQFKGERFNFIYPFIDNYLIADYYYLQ